MAEWVEKGSIKGPPGDSTGVPAGGTPGQLLSKTDSGTAWVDPPSTGNVLTGTSTGLVAHGEDAYAQKPIEVRVKGKTWVNRWPKINGGGEGITVTTDETGLITVSGSRDDGGDGTGFTIGAGADIVLVAGRTYAFSVSTADGLVTSSNQTGIMIYITGEGSPSWELSLGGRTSGIITVPAQAQNPRASIGVTKTVSETVNASFHVMLVDGTEAPDCFTPPASITSAQPENLLTSGKNLWVNPTDRTTSGVTLTNNDDGSLTVSGTNTASGTIYMGSVGPFALETGKTYTMSIDGDPDFSAYVNFRDSGNSLISSVSVGVSSSQTSTTFSPPESTSTFQMGISVKAGVTVSGTYKVMLNEGSVTQTPLPEVELRSLPNGTCDELVIKADGTCEVERRAGYIASYTDEEVTGEYVSTGNGLEAGASIVYELDEPTTEPQSPVTLPALPAPTFNQYHDSPVPSDTSTEYVRDINIAFNNLQAQISATTVKEATND